MAWKIVRHVDELKAGGEFQEKFFSPAQTQQEAKLLKDLTQKKFPDIYEETTVPHRISRRFPYAFAIWVPKNDAVVSNRDIQEGNIRKKI
jgi:hypothetical protein